MFTKEYVFYIVNNIDVSKIRKCAFKLNKLIQALKNKIILILISFFIKSYPQSNHPPH
jgi:hypothetical protein